MWKLPSSEAELNEMLKKEKARGYSQGHAAGIRKLDSDVLQCAKLAQRADFIDAAFLAALPVCMNKPIVSSDASLSSEHARKIQAAWWFANEAWRQRGY